MVADTFRKQVKHALEHLYDTTALEIHPLLPQLVDRAASRQPRAQQLRSVLKQGIESLRPPPGISPNSLDARSYQALSYRYVQGMSIFELENELGISTRQVQRDLQKGLDALCSLLWSQRLAEGASAEAAAGEPVAESEPAHDIAQELSQWEALLEPCDLSAMLDDLLAIAAPVPAEHHVNIRREEHAALPPVLADATLTRQALLQLVRLLARQGNDGTLDLRVQTLGKQVQLRASVAASAEIGSEAEWQTAQLLVQHQGYTLASEQRERETAVLLNLPQAIRTCLLVIDDKQDIHELFERYLAPYHYEVLHAYNSDEAMRLLATRQPDLITLDVMMPRVDGWQVLRQLQHTPATAGIPVIVCSVLKEPSVALSNGARGYLKKPVERLDLLDALARVQQPQEREPAPPTRR